TTNQQWKKYDLAILPGASTLRPQDIKAIRNWVQAGGTLVTNAKTSLNDQWGRPQDDYNLAKLFGAHYQGMGKGQSSFDVAGRRIGYSAKKSYAKVEVDGAQIIGKWANGDPALLEHRA